MGAIVSGPARVLDISKSCRKRTTSPVLGTKHEAALSQGSGETAIPDAVLTVENRQASVFSQDFRDQIGNKHGECRLPKFGLCAAIKLRVFSRLLVPALGL